MHFFDRLSERYIPSLSHHRRAADRVEAKLQLLKIFMFVRF